MKEFKQTQKYFIGGPRKIRLVADLIKKLKPKAAVEKLYFIRKRASEVLIKVVKAAMAQAREAGVSDENLVFKEIQIGEGPRLKRGRAASRGRWHPYKKRMSHVRVILVEGKNSGSKEVVSQTTEEKSENKEEEKIKKGAKNGTKS